ncbi:hypothetical protein NA57DRAFT_73951 [Rhizodiscina lignyota]|uniref:YDG domain-containing protein n=1 Tax=Rhizodiscina lignyota TaxID=1504668 RepID=A0A9P4IEJ0_9PEZI|nr:hypothetical protein NA57DRAFT_73951 [Rhizodiscina lignyota]
MYEDDPIKQKQWEEFEARYEAGRKKLMEEYEERQRTIARQEQMKERENHGATEPQPNRAKRGREQSPQERTPASVATPRENPRPMDLSSLKITKKPKTSEPVPLEDGASREATIDGPRSPPQSTEANRTLPQWYRELDLKHRLTQKLELRALTTRLSRIPRLIETCQDPQKATPDTFNQLRDELHAIMFFSLDMGDKGHKSWPVSLKKVRMLSETTGLPQIFDANLSETPFPWDIRADARELYNKWAAAKFNTDPLDGIELGRKVSKHNFEKRNADRIKKDYPNREHPQYYGGGNLLNGQWWPTQLCTVRDGAHGAAQGGIFGSSGKGAYSIVLSGGTGYQDRDDGDEIWYSGTDGADFQMTENTKRMIESATGVDENGTITKHPVRVIRSHNLSSVKSFYRPERGLRYDGLYDVLSYQVLDAEKQTHRFHLRRCAGQDPIRYQGPERRPTTEEIQQYEKIRKYIAG